MDREVDRVLDAARARGLEIGPRLETHGYFDAYAVGEALVMRIPRIRRLTYPVQRGAGPMLITSSVSPVGVDLGNVRQLFDGSLARQRDVVSPYLPRFIDLMELDGKTVTLFERPPGRALAAIDVAEARPRIPRIAAALAELHATFGFHGDLSPMHVFLDGDTVTFTDPLPVGAIGTAGFALPILGAEDAARMRDLAALAAMFAALHEAWLGFDRMVEPLTTATRTNEALVETIVRDLRSGTRATTRSITDPMLRDWVAEVCDAALEAVQFGASPGASAMVRRYLDAIANAPPVENIEAYRVALAAIAERAYARPSLLGFYTAHQQREETRQPQYAAMDELGAVHDSVAALDRLLAIVGELRARYVESFGEPAVVELAPLRHPDRMWQDSHDLHTLIVDVVALLEPRPALLGEAGGRFARIAALAPRVRESYAMATRRYINFVCSPF